MSGIQELRQRVLAAEERFGLNDSQRATYCERLVDLMNEIEACIRDQQGEIERQAAVLETRESEAVVQQAKIDSQSSVIAQHGETIEKLEAIGVHSANETEQLRTMLHSMLQVIEYDGGDGLAEAIQEIDRRVRTLVSAPVAELADEPAAEPAAEESDEQIEEPRVATAIAVGPVSVGPIEEIEDAPQDEAAAAPESESAIEALERSSEDTGGIEEIVVPVDAVEEPVDVVEEPVDVVEEPVVETAGSETATEGDGAWPGGGLDEIMERVSRLVEETGAPVAAPGTGAPEAPATSGVEDPTEEIAEDPARHATGTEF